MDNPAQAAHPIHPLLAQRWSRLAYDPRPLPEATLRSLFEAARWAASSMNEQPWRFLLARRDDAPTFQALLATLAPGNAVWAKDAGALILAAHTTRFVRNDRPNPWAPHDLGMAVAQLVFQATAEGLVCRAMGGFDADAARETLALPADVVPMAVLAVGYPGDHAALDEGLQARERSPRTRVPQEEFVFEGRFGRPWGVRG